MERLTAPLPADLISQEGFLNWTEVFLGSKNRQQSLSSQLAKQTTQKEDSISRENMSMNSDNEPVL